jgi:hypothetical protein
MSAPDFPALLQAFFTDRLLQIDARCAGLSGMDLSACSKLVIAQCKIMPPICSCTDPTLPMCTPTTTTTTSWTTSTTTSSTTTTTASPLGAFLEFTTVPAASAVRRATGTAP